MAYILYGGSTADATWDTATVLASPTGTESVLKIAPGASLEAWTAGTGGTQVTDLKLFTGSYTTEGSAAPSGIFPATALGTVLVWAQDTLDYLFVTGQGSDGERWLLRPINSTARLRTIEAAAYIPLAQKGANDGVAPLDGTGKVPSANLPTSGVSGVSSIATVVGGLESGAVTLTAADLAALTEALADARYLQLSDAAAVAQSGQYADLLGKPPTQDTIDNLPPGSFHWQTWDGTGTTPNRDTTRTDIKVLWYSPVIPSTSAGKALAGVDDWINTAP